MSVEKFYKVTCGIFYDREFMCGFVAKRKEGEESVLVIDSVDLAWDLYQEDSLEDYSECVRENSSYAFVHEEEISEKEFNNSGKWKEPTAKKIAVLSQDYGDDDDDDDDE